MSDPVNDPWLDRCAELLGCDAHPAGVAVAITLLISERERMRATIAELRQRQKSVPIESLGWDFNAQGLSEASP